MFILTKTDTSRDSDVDSGSWIGGAFTTAPLAIAAMAVAASDYAKEMDTDEVVWDEDSMSCNVDGGFMTFRVVEVSLNRPSLEHLWPFSG